MTVMRTHVGVCAFAVVLLTLAAAPAPAEPASGASIKYNYGPARNPKFKLIRQRLMDRRVLEELTEFVSPVRFKRDITLATVQCDVVNAFWNPNSQKLELCYELLADNEDNLIPFVEGRFTLPNGERLVPTVKGISRGEAVTGAFLGTVMHELGHAVFDLQEVPVLGREEDAADQMAAFLLVQFGPQVARTTIKGAAADWDFTAQRWDWLIKNGKKQLYYDVHSLPAQRLYNYVCVAYGHLPDTFGDFVEQGLLPSARARNCANEYRQVANAFRQTLLPTIDQALMEKVRARTWLRPEDVQ
jgi:putative metallopeptidase DUF4344